MENSAFCESEPRSVFASPPRKHLDRQGAYNREQGETFSLKESLLSAPSRREDVWSRQSNVREIGATKPKLQIW